MSSTAMNMDTCLVTYKIKEKVKVSCLLKSTSIKALLNEHLVTVQDMKRAVEMENALSQPQQGHQR